MTTEVLERWLAFELWVIQRPKNDRYFIESVDPKTRQKTVETNFDNYYKGRTINGDIAAFDWK